jgi:uncharacterized membrane protein YagU involved in acid resistance
MAASMVVPTALVIAPHWLAAVAGASVLLMQHVVVIPAMVGVTLPAPRALRPLSREP